MSYDLTKRLDVLKDQSEAARKGRLSPLGVYLKGIFVLGFLAFLVSRSNLPSLYLSENVNRDPSIRYSQWQQQTKALVIERRDYLRNSFFGETRARTYVALANEIMDLFGVSEPSTLPDRGRLLDFDSWGAWIAEAFAGLFLRGFFVLFACLHLWLVGIIGGFIAFRFLLLPEKTKDILGFLDRGRGPFYSGIYGPLRPNKSTSGTDLSCPSLACPKKVSKKEAIKHPLYSLLRRFSALNETNVELARVILAYRDYPSIVDEERVIEDPAENEGKESPLAHNPTASFKTNEEGTIESASLANLEAILAAHSAIKRSFKTESSRKENYRENREKLIEISKKLPPLARRLVLTLTPKRAEDLAKLPTQAVASAYLAIEAGKSLVFRKEGSVFFQISRFPHLQARAVVQSIVPYHEEYSGDLRLTIRQAIICSRRHGDFGRAILPVHMSIASRALRDWLEILSSTPKKRDDFADLVELDANLEELHLDFRKEFIKKLLASGFEESARASSTQLSDQLWKGLYYKSVILFPLEQLLQLVLGGVEESRIQRIGELLSATRKLQSGLSISARLPGFKRQAEEAEKDAYESGGITRALADDPKNKDLLEGWLIVRRMLIRYNWLSTRVGDSSVPLDGLIQAIMLDRSTKNRPEVVGFEALVPLRQRQFKELLGAKWAEQYYQVRPSSNDLDVYEDTAEFKVALQEIKEQAARGLFDKLAQGGTRN